MDARVTVNSGGFYSVVRARVFRQIWLREIAVSSAASKTNRKEEPAPDLREAIGVDNNGSDNDVNENNRSSNDDSVDTSIYNRTSTGRNEVDCLVVVKFLSLLEGVLSSRLQILIHDSGNKLQANVYGKKLHRAAIVYGLKSGRGEFLRGERVEGEVCPVTHHSQHHGHHVSNKLSSFAATSRDIDCSFATMESQSHSETTSRSESETNDKDTSKPSLSESESLRLVVEQPKSKTKKRLGRPNVFEILAKIPSHAAAYRRMSIRSGVSSEDIANEVAELLVKTSFEEREGTIVVEEGEETGQTTAGPDETGETTVGTTGNSCFTSGIHKLDPSDDEESYRMITMRREKNLHVSFKGLLAPTWKTKNALAALMVKNNSTRLANNNAPPRNHRSPLKSPNNCNNSSRNSEESALNSPRNSPLSNETKLRRLFFDDPVHRAARLIFFDYGRDEFRTIRMKENQAEIGALKMSRKYKAHLEKITRVSDNDRRRARKAISSFQRKMKERLLGQRDNPDSPGATKSAREKQQNDGLTFFLDKLEEKKAAEILAARLLKPMVCSDSVSSQIPYHNILGSSANAFEGQYEDLSLSWVQDYLFTSLSAVQTDGGMMEAGLTAVENLNMLQVGYANLENVYHDFPQGNRNGRDNPSLAHAYARVLSFISNDYSCRMRSFLEALRDQLERVIVTMIVEEVKELVVSRQFRQLSFLKKLIHEEIVVGIPQALGRADAETQKEMPFDVEQLQKASQGSIFFSLSQEYDAKNIVAKKLAGRIFTIVENFSENFRNPLGPENFSEKTKTVTGEKQQLLHNRLSEVIGGVLRDFFHFSDNPLVAIRFSTWEHAGEQMLFPCNLSIGASQASLGASRALILQSLMPVKTFADELLPGVLERPANAAISANNSRETVTEYASSGALKNGKTVFTRSSNSSAKNYTTDIHSAKVFNSGKEFSNKFDNSGANSSGETLSDIVSTDFSEFDDFRLVKHWNRGYLFESACIADGVLYTSAELGFVLNIEDTTLMTDQSRMGFSVPRSALRNFANAVSDSVRPPDPKDPAAKKKEIPEIPTKVPKIRLAVLFPWDEFHTDQSIWHHLVNGFVSIILTLKTWVSDPKKYLPFHLQEAMRARAVKVSEKQAKTDCDDNNRHEHDSNGISLRASANSTNSTYNNRQDSFRFEDHFSVHLGIVDSGRRQPTNVTHDHYGARSYHDGDEKGSLGFHPFSKKDSHVGYAQRVLAQMVAADYKAAQRERGKKMQRKRNLDGRTRKDLDLPWRTKYFRTLVVHSPHESRDSDLRQDYNTTSEQLLQREDTPENGRRADLCETDLAADFWSWTHTRNWTASHGFGRSWVSHELLLSVLSTDLEFGFLRNDQIVGSEEFTFRGFCARCYDFVYYGTGDNSLSVFYDSSTPSSTPRHSSILGQRDGGINNIRITTSGDIVKDSTRTSSGDDNKRTRRASESSTKATKSSVNSETTGRISETAGSSPKATSESSLRHVWWRQVLVPYLEGKGIEVHRKGFSLLDHQKPVQKTPWQQRSVQEKTRQQTPARVGKRIRGLLALRSRSTRLLRNAIQIQESLLRDFGPKFGWDWHFMELGASSVGRGSSEFDFLNVSDFRETLKEKILTRKKEGKLQKTLYYGQKVVASDAAILSEIGSVPGAALIMLQQLQVCANTDVLINVHGAFLALCILAMPPNGVVIEISPLAPWSSSLRIRHVLNDDKNDKNIESSMTRNWVGSETSGKNLHDDNNQIMDSANNLTQTLSQSVLRSHYVSGEIFAETETGQAEESLRLQEWVVRQSTTGTSSFENQYRETPFDSLIQWNDYGFLQTTLQTSSLPQRVEKQVLELNNSKSLKQVVERIVLPESMHQEGWDENPYAPCHEFANFRRVGIKNTNRPDLSEGGLRSMQGGIARSVGDLRYLCIKGQPLLSPLDSVGLAALAEKFNLPATFLPPSSSSRPLSRRYANFFSNGMWKHLEGKRTDGWRNRDVWLDYRKLWNALRDVEILFTSRHVGG